MAQPRKSRSPRTGHPLSLAARLLLATLSRLATPGMGALLLAGAVGAGAAAASAEEAKAPAAAANKVTVKGSDTIGGELGPALAKAFMAQKPSVQVVWEALGSKTAFVGLFDGSADLGASSRQVKEEEYQQAQRLGLELQEFAIGFDAISVVVNPKNPVPQLTLDQLADLFTGKLTNWKEVGGPDLPVKLVSRPTYSGTRTWFDEKVLRKGNAKGPEQLAASATVLETNEQIIPLVGREVGAVSFVGLGSLTSAIRAVPLSAAGKPAVEPELIHVRDGTYPLFRPLYLYTRGAPSGLGGELLRFVLSAQGQQLVAQHGFIPGSATSADVQLVAAPQGQSQSGPQQLGHVFFTAGGARFTAEAEEALAGFLARLPKSGYQLMLVGNADSSGRAEKNQRISFLRAKAVADWLVRNGVPRSALQLSAQSADAPLASNGSDEGRGKNRRVDVILLPRPATAGR
jgi:phosphate binding protein